jgi:hypothetical protein
MQLIDFQEDSVDLTECCGFERVEENSEGRSPSSILTGLFL